MYIPSALFHGNPIFNRPFQFEQLTVVNFDGSPTVCSMNRGWGINVFSKQSDNRGSWVPSTAQIGNVY